MRKLLTVLLLLLVFVAKNANAQGWEWAKIGVGNIDEYGQSVVTDAAGNVYVCGTYNSASFTFGASVLVNPGCPFSGTEACDVIYLLKCDPNGNVIWLKTVSGSGDAVSVANDNMGNIYMAGQFYSDSLKFGAATLVNDSDETYDVFIAKFDTSGNVIWAKSAKGNQNDFTVAVQADRSGNVYMTGYFASASITFGTITLLNDSAGTGNVFVVKYDPDGNVIWAKGAGGKLEDDAAYLATDRQNNVYVTGFFNSPSIIFGHDTLINAGGDQNMFIVKIDSGGNIVWANDPGNNDNISPASVSADPYGNVYVTGYYWGYVCDFGSFTLTNPDTANSGYTYDVFLVRYDTAGHIKWVRSGIENNYAQAMTVANDPSGNVYIAGTTISTPIVFGTDTIDGDIFLVKYDSLGNVIWAASAHGNLENDYPSCIAANTSGEIYMSGTLGSWVVDFGATVIRDSNNYYMFLAKFNTLSTSVSVVKQNSNALVFPNPVTTQLTISSPETITTVVISNLTGQAVYARQCNATQIQVDVADLPPGIYFVKINGTDVRKFVKQ